MDPAAYNFPTQYVQSLVSVLFAASVYQMGGQFYQLGGQFYQMGGQFYQLGGSDDSACTAGRRHRQRAVVKVKQSGCTESISGKWAAYPGFVSNQG